MRYAQKWIAQFVQSLLRAIGVLIVVLPISSTTTAETFVADPLASEPDRYYLNLISRLRPGDTLILLPGHYNEPIDLSNIRGDKDQWITISGPSEGPRPVISTTSTCCNVIQLRNTAYVAIKNIVVRSDSERLKTGIDGINANGPPSHDILIENCVVSGASLDQQTVAINSQSAAWNWTLRNNTIIGAGTGAYLGSPDGRKPFLSGLIEYNVFIDSIGYNLQIKHQLLEGSPFSTVPGGSNTVIRHNLFAKRIPQFSIEREKVSGSRPNVLIGGSELLRNHEPIGVELFGNYFLANHDGESLLQVSGSTVVHHNIFVGPARNAIMYSDPEVSVQSAIAMNNTIFGTDRGIYFAAQPEQETIMSGNLVFSEEPVVNQPGGRLSSNYFGSPSNAPLFLTDPTVTFSPEGFRPKSNAPNHRIELNDLTIASTDAHQDFFGVQQRAPAASSLGAVYEVENMDHASKQKLEFLRRANEALIKNDNSQL